MSGLLTLSALSSMPKAVILLLIVVVCVVLYLVGHLLNSYPLVIVASLVAIGLSLFSFIDEMYLLGACWLIYSVVATIFAFLHFYRNVRSAFWWTLGALIALVICAIPFDVVANVEENVARLLTILAPAVVCLLFGVVGGVVAPRVQFKDKNERKHLTNADPIIGEKVKIVKDKDGEFPARAVLGDIDWAIEPFYAYESFKVGDIVKVVKIKGVTLLCTRDQKDYRAELKKQRKEQEISRRVEQEELAAKREAIRSAKKLQREQDKLQKEKEKFEKQSALKKAREARLEEKAKQDEALRKAKAETKAVKKAAAEAAKEEAAKEEAAKEEAAKKKEAELALNKEEEPKVKKEKKETPVKEAKPQKVAKEKKEEEEPYKMLYIISSAIAVFLSLLIVIFAFIKALSNFFKVAKFIYFGLILGYLVLILVCEILKNKQKGEKEQVKKEETPAEKVEEVVLPTVEEKEKAEFVPFAVRLKKADKELKEAYNELKSEVLSYGIKSRVSSTGDSFRLHTKTYVKMVIAGKSLKLYLALNPMDYKDTTYPFDDASKMTAHKETPFVFKIKSGLSVRRAKVLIGDAAKKDGLVQGEIVPHNHAKDVK